MKESNNLVENIAYACVTKHCEGNAQSEAVHWINPDFSHRGYSFQDFETESNKIAAGLKRLGIQPGDVVSIFLPRSPELICAFFAVFKNQAISNILFSTLGPEALFDRLDNSHTKIIFTKKTYFAGFRTGNSFSSGNPAFNKKIINIKWKWSCLVFIIIYNS